MIPEIVEFRDDSLPTTSSGKVDRKKLSDPGEMVAWSGKQKLFVCKSYTVLLYHGDRERIISDQIEFLKYRV